MMPPRLGDDASGLRSESQFDRVGFVAAKDSPGVAQECLEIKVGWNVGGVVESGAQGLRQSGMVDALGLAADITYTVTNNAIRISAVVSNTLPGDRALTIYFALPADMNGGTWWNDPRTPVAVGSAASAPLPPPPPTHFAMGTNYATLPAGCVMPKVGNATYYLCGNTWFKPLYGANGVYYRVVPTP